MTMRPNNETPMHTTNLRKVGGSVMLAIPPEPLDMVHLSEPARLTVF
jgi:antitoxin ChpS